MPNHKSHGHEYIEPPRHDELPDGVRDVEADRSRGQKRPSRRFERGDTATSKAGAKGGRARRGSTSLSHRIDPSTLTPEYQRRARTLRRTLSAEIASTVGGGVCGVAASLMVKWAAQKTAAAEAAFASGDHEAFRKLSESARMDLLYAREHAAKEATSRAVQPWRPPPTAPATAPARALAPPPERKPLDPDLLERARKAGVIK